VHARYSLTRRRFVRGAGALGLLLAGCGRLPGQAAPPAHVHRIGVLSLAPTYGSAASLDALRQGLRELGWVEGQSLVIEDRYAESPDGYPDLVAELLRQPVDILLSGDSVALVAAKAATQTTPIVMSGAGDPALTGLVANLARPEGNITGTTTGLPGLAGKQLQLLTETVPGIAAVAVLLQEDHPTTAGVWAGLQEPARMLSVQLRRLEVRSPEELERAFTAATAERADALFVARAPLLNRSTSVRRIVDLAANAGLPAMYPGREFVTEGGLIAYGVNNAELYRRAATHVDKILKGARPSDLPVERPVRFDFVINLKTAQALGLTIPEQVLLQATEVIQ
jgi:putative ABC transport system substrate-binding protein